MRKYGGLIGNKNGQTHGMSGTKTYNSWVAMISRCTRSSTDRYKNYGGRGIKVCKRWMRFENFLSDMGPRPDNKTLDRINVNGDYTPINCRWSDAHTQYRNKSQNHILELNGEKKILSDWAKSFGVSNMCIYYHLNKGRNLEWIMKYRKKHNRQTP